MGMRAKLEAMLDGGQDTALLRFSLGELCVKDGDAPAAIPHLQQAVAQDPQYSAAWKFLGRALADAGRNEEAGQAFDQGIAVAEARGDHQAAKEMRVFLRRLARGNA
ncbi:MAG: tetratricopeptide repeat protein [Salinisphaeraceae bacterium]